MSTSTNVSQIAPFSILATVPPPSGITKLKLPGPKSKEAKGEVPWVVLYHPKHPSQYQQGSHQVQLNLQGLLLEDLLSHATKFVFAYSNAISATTETLKIFFKTTLADSLNDNPTKLAATTAWLFITMSKSSTVYRWHRDIDPRTGHFGPPTSRYSMTLIGPPTDVLRSNPAVDAVFPKVYTPDISPIVTAAPREAVNSGQIYRFTTGQADFPIHSTPVFDEDRIFVSVVYNVYQDT